MTAIVFPGQGSQRPGMGQALSEASRSARAVFDEASSAVGFDILAVCVESDEETLRQTQNAQIALYTCGIAAWTALRDASGLVPSAFAGHSVGEYAAVVASGVLSVADGAKLVRARGEIMARAGRTRPGTMAAVLGMDRAEIERVCNDVASHGVVVIANDNAPGQLVISGDTNAVHAASALASERGAKRVLPLNVSGAFHSPLMDESAAEMGDRLAEADFQPGDQTVAVYPNLTATRVERDGDWPFFLQEQLKNPVRWAESVRAMVNDGVTTFVECGVGEVLTGLARRIAPEATGMRVVDPATLEDAVSKLGQGVSA